MLHLVVRACVMLALILSCVSYSSAQQRIVAGREYFDRPSQSWLDTFLVADITLDAQGNILRKVDRYDIPIPGVHDVRIQTNFVKFSSHPDLDRRDLGPADVIDEFLGYDSVIALHDTVYRWSGDRLWLSWTAERVVASGLLDSIYVFLPGGLQNIYQYDYDQRGLITLNGRYDWGGNYSEPTRELALEYLYDAEGRAVKYIATENIEGSVAAADGPTYIYNSLGEIETESDELTRSRFSSWSDYGKTVAYATRGPLNSGNTWGERIQDVWDPTLQEWVETGRVRQFFDANGRYVRGESLIRVFGQDVLTRLDSVAYNAEGDMVARVTVNINEFGQSDTTSHLRDIVYDAQGRVTLITIREGEGTLPDFLVRYTFAYFGTSDVAEHRPPQESIGIYPNPTNGVIRLGSAAKHVEVIDLLGASVMTAANVEVLDLSDLADGVYTLILDGKPERVIKLRK